MVKFLKDIVLAASLALGMGACHLENTKPLKKDYPYLTIDRKEELENKFCDDYENDRRIVQDASDFETDEESYYRSSNREVTQFFGTHNQEIVNRVEEIAVEDHEAKGYSRNIISKIELGIKTPKKMKKICGNQAGACNLADIVTIPDDLNNTSFLDTLYHEMGHSLNWGNLEMGSISNEVYMIFKTYQFSKVIGSLMMMEIYDYVGEDSATTENPFPLMYNRGSIFAVTNFANHNADLEAAMNHVANNKHLILETDLEEKLNSLEGNNADKYFTIWNEFLNKGNLILELSKRMTLNEAMELRDFLKIINHNALLGDLTNANEAKAKYEQLSESFVLNAANTNPLFRGLLTFDVTPRLNNKSYQIGNDYGFGSPQHVQYTKRIVDLNQPYPCTEENPYTCTPRMRIRRDDQARAYHNFVTSAFNSGEELNKHIAIPYLVDYIGKFYPETDFEQGDFESIKTTQRGFNNILPYLVQKVGKFEYDYGDQERAKKLWDAALNIECQLWGIVIDPVSCEGSKNYIRYLQSNNP